MTHLYMCGTTTHVLVVSANQTTNHSAFLPLIGFSSIQLDAEAVLSDLHSNYRL